MRAAPVAHAHGPALLLLFEKTALSQKPGGYGTGRQWRPLDQALAVLWQAGAWREELIQLLELLAERADRRLHPLPWALPVPLRVHGHYSRAEIEAAYCFAEDDRIDVNPPSRPIYRCREGAAAGS